VSARSHAMRRPYWISALGHTTLLGALVFASGIGSPRLFVEGVNIVLPPSGTGPGEVKPEPAAAHQPQPLPVQPEAPEPVEQKKPQPEKNIVKEPSREGLLPPPKDDVPSLRPEETDAPKSAEKPKTEKKKPASAAAAGPGGASDTPTGGATGAGSGTGIGVEGGVLGANAPWYLVQLRDKIAANWRPPAAVGRSGEMRAVFHFRIESSGEVTQLEPAGLSNHFRYDIEARRAIEVSSPLPPLPEELGATSIGITLTFTQVY